MDEDYKDGADDDAVGNLQYDDVYVYDDDVCV